MYIASYKIWFLTCGFFTWHDAFKFIYIILLILIDDLPGPLEAG